MSEAAVEVLPLERPANERLVSLDALRGFDMFWIVGGEGVIHALGPISDRPWVRFLVKQLTHKDWEGVAFYDLIFPLFVFMVGVSLVFSLTKTIERRGRSAAIMRVVRRSIIIFALGILYYGGFSREWPNMRLLGVLQRIALCYFAAGLLFCFLKPKPLLGVLFGLLVVYWGLMSFVPVPGQQQHSFDQGVNLADYLDSRFLPGHRYVNDHHDPEGLLSTLPAIATCLLGVFAGLLLKNNSVRPLWKVCALILGGGALVGLGFLWGMQFPVIKKIWTSSYVLVAGGYSAMLLGFFYLIVDVLKLRGWAVPFIWIGMNPITIYLADHIIGFDGLAKRFVGGSIEKHLHSYGQLTVAVVSLAISLAFAGFLYRRKIFLRV